MLSFHLAAKQEALEESIKLKNQFRNLDEDEIEFLDSVLESTRAKEEAVKRETTEQLDLFRRQQEEADKALLEAGGGKEEDEGGKAGSPTAGESQWAVNARKRKRAKEKEGLKGLKIRRSSTSEGFERPRSASQEPEEAKATLSTADAKEKGAIRSGSAPKGKTAAAGPVSPAAEPNKAPGATSAKLEPPKSGGLGLAGYSSEDDD